MVHSLSSHAASNTKSIPFGCTLLIPEPPLSMIW